MTSTSQEYDDLLGPDAGGPLQVESQPAQVHLNQIAPNSWNPHQMTEEEQTDLERSVLEDGQWRPILVVELDAPDESMPAEEMPPEADYRIVDGEHLFHALTSLFVSGKHSGYVSVLVLGKNSAIPVWKQQEIGQTINHGMRGSQEDPEKTKQVLGNILKYRKPEVVAKRMGLGVEGIKHLTSPAGVKPKVSGPTSLPKSSSGSTPSRQGMSNAVKTTNKERKSYTIALVFDQADDLKAFEERLSQAADELGLDRSQFQGRNGQLRINTITQALEQIIEGGD